MTNSSKDKLKDILDVFPLTAELYYLLRNRNRPMQSKFKFRILPEVIDDACAFVKESRKSSEPGKRIFLFASLHYWIEHTITVGMVLAALGHKVTVAYLPYGDWRFAIKGFDLRTQNAYAKSTLRKACDVIDVICLLQNKTSGMKLPADVKQIVEETSYFDVQYTTQIEDVNIDSDLYRLRLRRNENAAKALFGTLSKNPPDVLIVPNGAIQEFGVAYRIGKLLGIKTVTYEFGDQKNKVWISQGSEVMSQDTDDLWAARQNSSISPANIRKVQRLMEERHKGAAIKNFIRFFDGIPPQDAHTIKETLNLDERPIILLALNVVGDSLTLKRNVYSKSMSEWVLRTIQYFTGKPEVQLVIRAHPGEVLLKGISMLDIIKSEYPKLPENITCIGMQDKINTYDLIRISSLGLVYTTTVGLEMALHGLPVVVNGKVHYRGKGFTYDPDSWVNYFKFLGQMCADPGSFQLSKEQIDNAWKYAYLFFFEYPLHFPWHLASLREDYLKIPISQLLKNKGNQKYLRTFNYLIGEPIDWEKP